MISEMAIDDVEVMIEDGLKPTPKDIIRLNALGLKVELNQDCAQLYAMPRVSFLGSLNLREPTIAHNIWIDRILSYCDKDDLSTCLAVEAYALSRHHDALPDADNKDECVKAVKTFIEADLRPFTANQIRAAVVYATKGASAIEGEFAAVSKDAKVNRDLDAPSSVGVGVLFETIVASLGLSIREISSLPISKARILQDLAFNMKGLDITKNRKNTLLADYIVTKNEIKERLLKEKEGLENG